MAGVSVIIPCWNEESFVAAAIASAREAGECEVIVVDGGSDDGTRERARGADAVLTSPRGRAVQQNLGAARARGDVLLFLHADCRLPPGSLADVERALSDSRAIGGCFRQRVDNRRAIYRWLEFGNNTRVRLGGWIYGDQGLFVRAGVFRELGGFPELPLLEDLEFSKQLRRRGRLVLLERSLTVSARRWERAGPVRQTLRNWKLIALAHLGVPLGKLAAEYQWTREE